MIVKKTYMLLIVASVMLSACSPTNNNLAQNDDDFTFRRIEAAKINSDLALQYLQVGQLKIAKEKIDKALIENPNSDEVANVAGLISIRLNKDDDAEDFFNKSLSINPNSGSALNNYGVFLLQNKYEPKKALSLFYRALQDPYYKTQEVILINIASAKFGAFLLSKKSATANQYDDMVEDIGQALFKNSHYHPAYIKLIEIQTYFKKYGIAKQTVQKLHGLVQPTSYSTYLALKLAIVSNNGIDKENYKRLLLSKFPKSIETREYLRYLKGKRSLP